MQMQAQWKGVNKLPKLFPQYKNEKYAKQMEEIEHRFEAKHDEEKKVSEITIYGVIGNSFWNKSISAQQVVDELNAAGDNDIVIRLNSPGGDAFDGITISNRLREHKGKVTTHVDGYACSAASLIPPASDETIMGLGTMIMIHEATTIVWGTKKDMRKEANVLEKLEKGVVDIYMTVAKVDREEIETMVDNETWFTAEEAVAIGFASKIVEIKKPEQPAQPQQMDSETYKNTILARFMANKPEQAEPTQAPPDTPNLLGKFKRGSQTE